MRYKLGFIGCGNMGGALVTAAAKIVKAGEIAVCDRDEEKVRRMEGLGAVGTSIEELVTQAEFVVLGVKPQVLGDVVSSIAPLLQARENLTVITMAAGVSTGAVQSFIGKTVPVIRIMPNTPVEVGEGMVLYALNGVSEVAHAKFLEYFSKAGKLALLPEEQIDGGSALSGCGPAFVYAFAEGLIAGATQCGVGEEEATLYAAQTLKGAAEMLLKHGNPVPLRKAVCSPNGTTLAGIKALEDNDFWNITAQAVLAAYKRTLELKQ